MDRFIAEKLISSFCSSARLKSNMDRFIGAEKQEKQRFQMV